MALACSALASKERARLGSISARLTWTPWCPSAVGLTLSSDQSARGNLTSTEIKLVQIAILTLMTSEERALNILRELHAAEEDLVDKTVVLTDGKAGTIERVYLDECTGFAYRSPDMRADGRFRW
jgi:hypothetical protein